MKAFVLLILALLADTNARPAEISSDVGAPVPARVFGARQVSDPLNRLFPRIPLKVAVDISSAEDTHPGIEAWAAVASNLCEQWYSVVCAALGENDVPQQVVLRVIAGTGGHAEGNVITLGVEDIQHNPSDHGSVIHELVHVVQNYRYGWFRNKGVGWLVEGIADYVRFYLYESDPKFGNIQTGRSSYADGYRTTACFLDYVVRKYDASFVRKLHRALREGRMSSEAFDQMLAKDADVAASHRKEREELFKDFMAEWQQNRSSRTSDTARPNRVAGGN